MNKLLSSVQPIATLLVFVSSIAFADGDAIVRPATPSEKQFLQTTKQALKLSTGTLPEGWEYSNESSLAAEDILHFAGKSEYPIQIEYKAHMKRVEGQAERELAHRKASEETRPMFAKLNELMRKMQDRNQAASRSMQQGNRQEYEKAKAEMEEIQREYDGLLATERSPAQIMEDAEYALRQDTEITIRTKANHLAEQMSGALLPLDIPGAKAAVRIDSSDRHRPSSALILFGDWTIERFGAGSNQSLVARRVPLKEDSLTRVYTLAVRLECDKDRMESLLASRDFAALQGQLR